MRAAVVEVVTRVACPRERLFDLALDMDVHSASLAASGETATTSSGSPHLRLGDEVTFRARHLGLVWRMTSRVTELDRPRRFVDEQVRGPFASLRHEHLFATQQDGATRMTDRMELVAPLGPVGRVVVLVLLERYMTGLLRTRAEALRQRAEADPV